MTLTDYAHVLGNPVRIDKTPEIKEFLDRKTKELYTNSYTRKGRDEEHVRNCVEKMVNERALAKLIGGTLSKVHEYDVDGPNGDTFECKSWKKSWFSFKDVSEVRTMMKHKDKIDYMVAAECLKEEDYYLVNFRMMCDMKTFKHFVRESYYFEGWLYEHRDAVKYGDAIYTDYTIRPWG